MKRPIRSLFLLLLLFCGGQPAFAQADSSQAGGGDSLKQDRILLMNGRELRGHILEIGMGELVYEFREDGEVKESSLPLAEVYSVNPKGEEERILYEQDSARGNTLDTVEMRYFLRGERDAIDGYRTPWTTVGGVAFGAASAYFLKFSVFTLTVPLVYTLGASIPKISIDKATVSDPAYLDHKFYRKGYEREARGERFLNALKGSAGGVLLGMALYAIIHPDKLR